MTALAAVSPLALRAASDGQITLAEACQILGEPAPAILPPAFVCAGCDQVWPPVPTPWRESAGRCDCGGLICATCARCQGDHETARAMAGWSA